MSNPHRILILGVGSIGERHLRCFQQTERCEVGLCEPNGELHQRIAQRYAVSDAFGELDAVPLDRFDAAVVCTPASTHIPIATRLAEAGRHIMIEKPLSTSPDGIDRLKQLCDQRALTVAVAYVYRAHPVVRALKRVMDERRFGRPLQLTAVAGQHFPTYRPAYREIYYNDRATGGGAIQDALTHVMNGGEWLIGPMRQLTADAAHMRLEGVDVEDTVHVMARHQSVHNDHDDHDPSADAALACYSLNQHQAPNEITYTIACEHGTVRGEMHNFRWMWMTEPGGAWQIEPLDTPERDAMFVDQAHMFLDAVDGRAAPHCTLAEGEQTLRVNLAALRSADDASKFERV